MDRRTTIAGAITVGVIGAAAALAWSERRIATDRERQVQLEQRSNFAGPARNIDLVDMLSDRPAPQLRVDPPDAEWRSEPSVPILTCDAALAPAKLRFGTGRPLGKGPDGGFDYKAYEKYGASLLRNLDASHTLIVWAGDGFESESWVVELPAGTKSGQAVAGNFSFSSCLYARESDELHGTLKLSELPDAVDQTLFFELRVKASPNRRIHAEGPVTVRPSAQEAPEQVGVTR